VSDDLLDPISEFIGKIDYDLKVTSFTPAQFFLYLQLARNLNQRFDDSFNLGLLLWSIAHYAHFKTLEKGDETLLERAVIRLHNVDPAPKANLVEAILANLEVRELF
jgi:hypothetical protein